jgi:hypothetical protein
LLSQFTPINLVVLVEKQWWGNFDGRDSNWTHEFLRQARLALAASEAGREATRKCDG